MSETEQELTALSIHENEDLCSEVEDHPNESHQFMGGETQSCHDTEAPHADSLCTKTESDPVSIASDEEEYTSDEIEDSSDEEAEAEFIPECEYEGHEYTERDDRAQEEQITEYTGSALQQDPFSEGQSSSQDKKDNTNDNDGDCLLPAEPDEEVIILQATLEEDTESDECTDKSHPFMFADEEIERSGPADDHLNADVIGDLKVSTNEVIADTEISHTETPEDASPGAELSENSDSEYDPTGDIMIVSEDSAEDALTGSTLEISEDSAEDTLPGEAAENITNDSSVVSLDTVLYSNKSTFIAKCATESEVPNLSPESFLMDGSSSDTAKDVQENAEEQNKETADMINYDTSLPLGDPLSDPTKPKEEKGDGGQGQNLEEGQSCCAGQHEKVNQCSAEEQSNHGTTKETNNKDHAGRQESGNKGLDCQPENSDEVSGDMEIEDEEQVMQERITQI